MACPLGGWRLIPEQGIAGQTEPKACLGFGQARQHAEEPIPPSHTAEFVGGDKGADP